MGKRVVAMRSPSANRSWMVSACSMMLCLVRILCERVVDLFMGGVCCKSETSLQSYCWSSTVVSAVASRISSNQLASSGCGIGKWNLIDLGWSGSLVEFVVDCASGQSNGMCMLVLTPLWSKKACAMVCVGLVCGAI